MLHEFVGFSRRKVTAIRTFEFTIAGIEVVVVPGDKGHLLFAATLHDAPGVLHVVFDFGPKASCALYKFGDIGLYVFVHDAIEANGGGAAWVVAERKVQISSS